MYITLTRSQGTPEQLAEVGRFLANFLPRMKEQPGVLAVYHFDRPDKGDDYTIIIWDNQEALKAYREGSLVKDAIAFENAHNMPATREAYPLALALSDRLQGIERG